MVSTTEATAPLAMAEAELSLLLQFVAIPSRIPEILRYEDYGMADASKSVSPNPISVPALSDWGQVMLMVAKHVLERAEEPAWTPYCPFQLF